MKTIYASNTVVSVDKSQSEIKKILSKYGATAFAFAEGNGKALLQFELKGRRIMFKLPLPAQPSPNATKPSIKTYDQICRSRWRSLCLGIKAKLECVHSEITTLEQEFMAHIILPNGSTVGDVMGPQIAMSYERNEMPPLLGMR